jgi:hypothetical protein
MTYFLKGDYMSFIHSTRITKRDDQYIIEFPLIDNAMTSAFERYKFKDHDLDENEFISLETIRFYPDHVDVIVKPRNTAQGLTMSSLLNTDVNSLHFRCQCMGDMDKDKIKNLTITNIVPEFNVKANDVRSNSSL